MARKESADPRAAAWWDAVLAGDTDEPHPRFGQDVHVRVRDGSVVVSGELRRAEDRDRLVRQAKARIGSAFRAVDASGLRVVETASERGVLQQTLIAAYPDAGTARLAGRFVVEHGRVRPLGQAVIEPGATDLRAVVPAGSVEDAKARLARGEALLAMRVDEIDAFRVRELMEEDTRSTWTTATPPTPF